MVIDYKKDFPIFKNTCVAYLDNAATAQRPRCVIDAVDSFYEKSNANPLRGLYPLSVEATEIYENARRTVAGFIGAGDPDEIVFTHRVQLRTEVFKTGRRDRGFNNGAPQRSFAMADGGKGDRCDLEIHRVRA